ncbi:MAG: hypothetical protein AAGJ73_13275 [Pseudomonadota bacterium]
MAVIRFKLKVQTLNKTRRADATRFDIDRVTKNGRTYRLMINLIEPTTIGDKELSDLRRTVEELIPVLIKAGYHAPDVEKMSFGIRRDG